MQDYLIIADGEPLEKSKTCALARDKFIIVLDGALSQVMNYGMAPKRRYGEKNHAMANSNDDRYGHTERSVLSKKDQDYFIE